MRFVRRAIEPLEAGRVRSLAAREGWLIESPEVTRAGFGGCLEAVALDEGASTTAREALEAHELLGVEGPAGSGVVAFAALPFDRHAPAAISIPRFTVTQSGDGAWLTGPEGDESWRELLAAVAAPRQGLQRARSLRYRPSPDEYAHRVALAVEVLRRKEIDKVVLARAAIGTVPEALDPAALAERLRSREPNSTLYGLPTPDGRRFVGASPELLVSRRGATVRCHPLAGTIALPPGDAPDDYETWLLGSAKNLHEHSLVVDQIVGNLERVYDDIEADAQPSIVPFATVAHLGTWITATSHDRRPPDCLEVLRMLHPTAAVGGLPSAPAYELLRQLEQHDRGAFAGPVGWVDAQGDGEWWIGLRGLVVDGHDFEAWAGAGIVSESDPVAEREETRNKLAVALTALLEEF